MENRFAVALDYLLDNIKRSSITDKNERDQFDTTVEALCIARLAQPAKAEASRFVETAPELLARIERDAPTIAKMREALVAAIAKMEAYEVQIDGEWGCCRDLPKIEKDGDLSPEILQAREALKG